MGNNKSIIYKNCDEGQKSMILTGFKQRYSQENVSHLGFVNLRNPCGIKIYSGDKEIIFENKMEFINFVKNLGRPFILEAEYVYFVYK